MGVVKSRKIDGQLGNHVKDEAPIKGQHCGTNLAPCYPLRSHYITHCSPVSSGKMASRLLLLAAVFIFCVALVSSEVKIEDDQTQVVKGANRKLLPLPDCGGLCKVRCGSHSRPKVCLRACGTCCARCKCVPPGTSGNREMCGRCYTDMTTHGNRPKCP